MRNRFPESHEKDSWESLSSLHNTCTLFCVQDCQSSSQNLISAGRLSTLRYEYKDATCFVLQSLSLPGTWRQWFVFPRKIDQSFLFQGSSGTNGPRNLKLLRASQKGWRNATNWKRRWKLSLMTTFLRSFIKFLNLSLFGKTLFFRKFHTWQKWTFLQQVGVDDKEYLRTQITEITGVDSNSNRQLTRLACKLTGCIADIVSFVPKPNSAKARGEKTCERDFFGFLCHRQKSALQPGGFRNCRRRRYS